VRIAGNPADRCAHQCGLDHTAVVLAAVIVAMFIAFQLAWTFAILSARTHFASLTVSSGRDTSSTPQPLPAVLTHAIFVCWSLHAAAHVILTGRE